MNEAMWLNVAGAIIILYQLYRWRKQVRDYRKALQQQRWKTLLEAWNVKKGNLELRDVQEGLGLTDGEVQQFLADIDEEENT